MIFNEDTEIPNLCKRIVEICTKNGVVNEEELDKRLGQLFADRCLGDVNYKEQPAKPEVIVIYASLSRDKKFLYDKENPGWRDLPTIAEYLNGCSAADAENNSNVYWLKHWIPKVDPKRREKLQAKLKEFLDRMPHAREIEPTIEVHTDEPPQEVKELVDIFGGNEIKGDWRRHANRGIPVKPNVSRRR